MPGWSLADERGEFHVTISAYVGLSRSCGISHVCSVSLLQRYSAKGKRQAIELKSGAE